MTEFRVLPDHAELPAVVLEFLEAERAGLGDCEGLGGGEGLGCLGRGVAVSSIIPAHNNTRFGFGVDLHREVFAIFKPRRAQIP